MAMSDETSRASSSSSSSSSPTVVNLFCPSVSQLVVPLRVGSVKEKLDLGAIARAFGIEPATLKLNGHFISRGADLIACSVTWKSLISFFAKRGLSTGSNDHDALIVDGKLCKAGVKRVHGHCDFGNHHQSIQYSENGNERKSQLDEVGMLKKCKINGAYTGADGPADRIEIHESTAYNDFGLKRKLWLEGDRNPLKKIRMDTNCSGNQKGPFDTNSGIPSGHNDFNRSLKRVREDEFITAMLSKRTR